jgi:hypothetical protein
MFELDPRSALWWWAGLQLCGLGSAWMARVNGGCRHERTAHLVFFFCLTVLGVATVMAMASGPRWCLSSGTTLSLMLLTATWDFSANKNVAW